MNKIQEHRILITWWTGRLWKACKKIFPNAIYPTRKDMDITNPTMIKSFIKEKKPKYIIHLAALAAIPACEENKELAWEINVQSTKNLVEICKENWVEKFLYLQTACIFSWENAPYDENSLPNPKHYYGFTKAIAEEIIKSYNDDSFKTLIARTNFTTMPWEYEKAFTDRFWTYLFAQGVAKWMKEYLEDNKGQNIIHICGDKKISMYEYATLWWSNVWKLNLAEYNWVWLTRDMSLTTKNWHTYKIEDSDFNDN